MFAQIGGEDCQLAKSFASPTITSFDNDEEEKIERIRATTKQVKKSERINFMKLKEPFKNYFSFICRRYRKY